MREKLFGTVVPDSIIERLERGAGCQARGPQDLRGTASRAGGNPGVAGAHVMAPMNFAEIPAAIEESGVLKRKR